MQTSILKTTQFLLLACCFAGGLMATTAIAQEDIVGSVTRISGQVEVTRGGQAPVALSLDDALQRTDTLHTFADAMLEVSLLDGSSFTLDENTRVTIAQYVTGSEPKSLLQMARGRLRNQVSTAFSGNENSYQVATREGVMGVQGTVFEVIADLQETNVFVYEGVVGLTSNDPGFTNTVVLQAGDFASIRLGEPISPPAQFSTPVTEGEVALDANSILGSGGEQARVSGGNQNNDPNSRVPSQPDQFGNGNLTTPPPPRPPGGNQ